MTDESRATQYEHWPKDGCTLAEALRRCIDPDLLAAWDPAEDLWRRAGEPSRFPKLRERMGVTSDRQERYRIHLRREQTLAAAIGDFLRLLGAGRLVSTGREGSALAEHKSIPVSAWRVLRIVNLYTSKVVQAGKSRTEIFDVRVYPVLLAPDFDRTFDGATFPEVFKRHVLEDPEVVSLAKPLLGKEHAITRMVEEGRTEYDFSQWSLTFFSDHDSPIGILADEAFDRRFSPRAVVTKKAIIHRFRAIIDKLRAGTLTASGVPTKPHLPSEVFRSVWFSYHFAISPMYGDLLESVPEDAEEHMYVRKWSSLMLLPATAKQAPAGIFEASLNSGSERTAVPRRKPRTERVLKALEAAGVDLQRDQLTPSEIIERITPHLTPPPRTANDRSALATLVRRVRSELQAPVPNQTSDDMSPMSRAQR